MAKTRLQLMWYNKNKAIIPAEEGKYGYMWVEPSDPRYCETHTLVLDEYVRGKQTPKTEQFQYSPQADLKPQDDNLLILGESGDVLESLTRVPELAKKYVGKARTISLLKGIYPRICGRNFCPPTGWIPMKTYGKHYFYAINCSGRYPVRWRKGFIMPIRSMIGI